MSASKSSVQTTSRSTPYTAPVPNTEVEKIVVIRLYVGQGDTRSLQEVEDQARTALTNAFVRPGSSHSTIIATVDKRYLVKGAIAQQSEYDHVTGTYQPRFNPASNVKGETSSEYIARRSKIEGRSPREAMDDLKRHSPVRSFRSDPVHSVKSGTSSRSDEDLLAVDEIEDIDLSDLDLSDLDEAADETATAAVTRIKKGPRK